MDAAIGEIRMFAGNFAPRGWALCQGALLPISKSSALFSILGTQYGGDGKTTFALPDLRGRMPVGSGLGPGLTDKKQGEKGGTETYKLTVDQMPAHTHASALKVADGKGDSFGANGNYLASKAVDVDKTPQTTVEVYKTAAGATFANGATLAGVTTGNTGTGEAILNESPFTGINYIICMEGIFPSRS